MAVHAVIMAGGRGERFWPLSREDKPKQFLALDGERTLLQRTVDRLGDLVPSERTWVVTRADYASLVAEQLPGVPTEQVLLEPQGRDTAPCVALAAIYVGHFDPDAVMVMLPADHLVLQEERFREVLSAAVSTARESESLVTLGIRPTRPETGYGYIRSGKWLTNSCGSEVFRVEAFTEKPPRERAMAYLQDGGYFWNSGIFIWKVTAIRKALQKHLPGLMEGLAPLERALGTNREAEEFQKAWAGVTKVSIDYGVLEQAENVLVLPCDFGWDDLGTWAALERVTPADDDGNVLSGRTVALDTTNSILQAKTGHRVLVAFGVSGLVVVDTVDAVLVTAKDRVADLKAVVSRLEANGFTGHVRVTPTGDGNAAD